MNRCAFVGIDIGSRTTCAVVFKNDNILSHSLIFTGFDSAGTSKKAAEDALARIDLTLDDIGYIVASGYGRYIAPLANETATEISCHAKGTNWLFPTVRTIIDMGGQDCKAIRIDGYGNHVAFAMNDKCAAGTGRFLELMAETLGLSLENIGRLSLLSEDEVEISATCAVFAKSEVVTLLRAGIPKNDILAGLHEAVAVRVFRLLKGVGIEKDLAITGGVAWNIGIVRRLEKKTGLKVLIPEDPQIVGALGAALIASQRVKSNEYTWSNNRPFQPCRE